MPQRFRTPNAAHKSAQNLTSGREETQGLRPHRPDSLRPARAFPYRGRMDTMINEDTGTASWEPSPPTMRESLTQRQRDIIRRCREEMNRTGEPTVFGMTTALALLCIPVPGHCDLDTTKLHTVYDTTDARMRTRRRHIHPHVWKHTGRATNGVITIGGDVRTLHPFHAWMQLASHMPLESVIELGDAAVTAATRQPTLARGRTGEAILTSLRAHTRRMPPFRGKRRALLALPLITANVDSPMESRQRLSLLRHGIPMPAVGYTVPNATFKSGAPMTLDMAWPRHRIALEYDGDHHRTDKTQWRRDRDKRNLLRGRGWIIIEATAGNLADEASQSEFAFQMARQFAARGAPVPFTVTPMPMDELAKAVAQSKGCGDASDST